jgi:hypothetical protein
LNRLVKLGESVSIEVTVRAVDGAGETVGGFNQLWAYYVRGFDPAKHCQECLVGQRSGHFQRVGTPVGVTMVFDECADFRQVYICGMAAGAKGLRGERNLHLAMVEEAGAEFAVTTYNGFELVVRNARRLVIPEKDPALAHLGEDHYGCKNFRFGVGYYGHPGLGVGRG